MICFFATVPLRSETHHTMTYLTQKRRDKSPTSTQMVLWTTYRGEKIPTGGSEEGHYLSLQSDSDCAIEVRDSPYHVLPYPEAAEPVIAARKAPRSIQAGRPSPGWSISQFVHRKPVNKAQIWIKTIKCIWYSRYA